MINHKKPLTFLLVLVVALTLLPQLTQAYESVSETITSGDLDIPIIEDKIIQLFIVAGGVSSGEYGHLEFRDENNAQIFEVWNHNYISRVYNSAGTEVCQGRTDGSPDPTPINALLERNGDGTYDITFTSENVADVNCNNINLVTGSGTLIKSLSATQSGLTSYTYAITTTQDEGLWTGAYDVSNSVTLSGYNATLNETPNAITYNTLSYFNMTGKSANDYFLTTTKENFTSDVYNITWDGSNSVSYTATLYGVPSINITFYDLLNNNIINDVDIIFDGESSYFTETIADGNYYSLIDADYYRIVPQATGYAPNNYYINLTPNTAGVINAYLVNETGSNDITLTVQDGSLIAVPDALVSVYFRNGTNLRLVATGRTSIIGKTGFTLNPSYTHTFIVEASNYDTKSFDYLPTESLTVTLSNQQSVEYTTVLDTISYSITPSSNVLLSGGNQDFTFTVSDSNSQIVCFSIEYQNGTYPNCGSPAGGVLIMNINTTAWENERLLFYYNITTIGGESYQDSFSYYIMPSSAGENTGFSAFKNFSYTSKALSLLAVLLITMAMLTLAKMGFGASLITMLGTFLLVTFTWLGWVNAWLGYTTAILVLLMTIFKGGIFE